MKLYGQDWTLPDRIFGILQKVGLYYNVPLLRSMRKPRLKLEDERRIYSSSKISINFHEEYQRQYGDLNERTFKIPASGGFEIIDDVISLSKYFTDGKDIVIARNKKDWFEKIHYYIANPEKRLPIIKEGRKTILQHHTYHQRVKQLINLIKK